MVNPINRTSLPELSIILLLRLAFLWLLVLLSLALPNDEAFYAFMGVAFIITIPYSLWLRSKLRTAQFAPLQFLVDLVLVTGLIYLTGGVHSELTLLYPLVILAAGLVGTPKQAGQITVLGIVIYLLMAALLSQDLVAGYQPQNPTASARPLLPTLLLRIASFACFGAASAYLAKRCSYIHRHNNDLFETIDNLLNCLPTGVLILDRSGQIIRANPAACALTSTTADALQHQTFTGISVSGDEICEETYGTTAFLSRPGSAPLPVSYAKADISLPAAALDSDIQSDELITATLVIFSDISRPLELEGQLKQVERITAATRIAGEMAHEIRTPLTSISASIQLLQHYEAKATAADWLPNSPRRQDREELFAHINDAAARMNTVVKNFVDFAEFSPADLLSIIKLDSDAENEGYIGRLNTKIKGFENGQNSDSGRRSNDSESFEQNPAR